MVKHQKCLQPATIQLSVDIEFQGSHLTSDAKKIQCTFHSMKVEGVQWGVARHPVASIRSPYFLGNLIIYFTNYHMFRPLLGCLFLFGKPFELNSTPHFNTCLGSTGLCLLVRYPLFPLNFFLIPKRHLKKTNISPTWRIIPLSK